MSNRNSGGIHSDAELYNGDNSGKDYSLPKILQIQQPTPKLHHDDVTGIDFATLIDEIAEELFTDKLVVKELSFMLSDKPQRSEIEHLDVKALLILMRENEIISEHNMEILELYANSIQNTKIVDKIKDFKKQSSNATSTANSQPITTLTNIVPTHTANTYGDNQQSSNPYPYTLNQQQSQPYQTNFSSCNQSNYSTPSSFMYSTYNANNIDFNNSNSAGNYNLQQQYGMSSLNMSYGSYRDNNSNTNSQFNAISFKHLSLPESSTQQMIYLPANIQDTRSFESNLAINAIQSQPSNRARDDIYRYPMHVGKIHGVCLIINNVTFNCSHLNQRAGSDVDVANLNRVFTKLNYTVVIHNDLSVDEMEVVAKKYSKEVNHTDYDSFVCCVLTHGSNDDILYGTDGKEIRLNRILQMFHSSQCQSLFGKPKIFIIQACRGSKEDVGGRGYQDIEKQKIPQYFDSGSKIKIDLPDMSDFLVAYTTTHGYVSWRSKSKGTWYITKLCDLLESKHEEYDLMTILTEVNNKIASEKTIQGFKQMPAPVTYLRGLICIP